MRQEAIEIAEFRAHAATDAERAMIDDGIVLRAEEIRGDPVRTDVEPTTGEPVYEFDSDRERRADHYAAIALGRATPIDLHHEAFVSQSVTKARTKADDRRAIKYLLAWCKRKGVAPTLQAVTRRVAVQFMDDIRGTVGDLEPITLNKYLGRLSRYWQWLSLRGDVESDPWVRLKVPSPRRDYNERERPFTDNEVAKLLSGPAPQHMQDLMKIAALTGARLDAIVDLRVKNCVGGLFVFKPQKKETKPRPVPIHSDLASIIARRTGGKTEDEGLFPEWPPPKKAGSYRERSFKASNAFTSYRRSVGVEHKVEGKRRSLINFHSFRRWFITKAEQADQPPHIIATVVGHNRGSVTLDTYSRGPLIEQMRRCVEAVRLPTSRVSDATE
jgi:integrase